MSRCLSRSLDKIPSFPRVSGDEPAERFDGEGALMFSPRERG